MQASSHLLLIGNLLLLLPVLLLLLLLLHGLQVCLRLPSLLLLQHLCVVTNRRQPLHTQPPSNPALAFVS